MTITDLGLEKMLTPAQFGLMVQILMKMLRLSTTTIENQLELRMGQNVKDMNNTTMSEVLFIRSGDRSRYHNWYRSN